MYRRTKTVLGLIAFATSLLISNGCDEDTVDDSVQVVFDLDGLFNTPQTFWDHPFPSDLRLTAGGKPNMVGFPNPKATAIVDGLIAGAADRLGYPVISPAYFRFNGEIAPQDLSTVIPAMDTATIHLIDIDADSPTRGRLYPVVAHSFVVDDYLPEWVLGVAPRPGFVLEGNRTYAYVIRRGLNDASGRPLGVASAIRDLAAGQSPVGNIGEAARAIYSPLWETLALLNIDPTDVAAATVFTTADVVAALETLSNNVRSGKDAVIANLVIDPDDGASHARFCELIGTVSFPRFQKGTPPYDTDGQFEYAPDGLPIEQAIDTVPLTITLPNGEMPVGGFPLMTYFHGSGGLSTQVVDRGKTLVTNGPWVKGEGPAYVVAEHGIAAVSSALPVNPERVEGASDYAYLNFKNLPAFPYTFRQGVIEQRLLLDAMVELTIDPATVAGCTGLSLPSGETAYRFNDTKLVAQGQSMGGMYTNMVAAVEPRFGAVVPTGAGGLWNVMVIDTALIPGVKGFLALLLGTPELDLTFLHPGLTLLSFGWETGDPLVFMPRLARNPLPGHPARHIYEPVGKDDQYFPIAIFDAAALSYGNQQAGSEHWPSMQQALALDGRDGLVSYPVTANRTSGEGEMTTGVVVQYLGDGIADPHSIYAQLDEVKYQYGCFFKTYFDTGVAKVLAPAPLGTPCN